MNKVRPKLHVYLQELDARLRLDANAARQETLQMCEGMKRITLPVSTDEEVRLVMVTVPLMQIGSLAFNSWKNAWNDNHILSRFTLY